MAKKRKGVKWYRKKRIFALLFILIVGLLFLNTNRIGRLLYPIHYRQDIQISSLDHGVDPYLISAIIRVESHYNPTLSSRKGAVGLMQIMPDTADWIIRQGGYANLTKQRLRSPDVNIEVGAWYINHLYGEFKIDPDRPLNDSDISIIAAAYNAGPGNVNKWLKQGVWNGKADTIDRVPYGETRHYIQRVLYYYKKYKRFYADVMPFADS